MAAYTTIDDPEAYFQIKTYTGNGSTQSLTLDGDTDMQPDFVWIKNRDEDYEHTLFDSVRGVTKFIRSSTNGAEQTNTDTLTAFGSDGFSVGSDGSVNDNTDGFVAWCWKESVTAGFDILTYTGTQSTQNVSHDLSAVPHFHIIKDRNNAENLFVYHQSIGNTGGLFLNLTTAEIDNAGHYNDTDPTSSVFTVQDTGGVNHDTTSNGHVAYLWSEKQGFSKFGGYTGNGNADGPFVYTGFRPAFILCKSTSETRNWFMYDTARSSYNVVDRNLYANKNEVEYNDADYNAIDILSNGFKFRNNDTGANNSGEPHIFMAFAEAPFVNSNGVPCNAR